MSFNKFKKGKLKTLCIKCLRGYYNKLNSNYVLSGSTEPRSGKFSGKLLLFEKIQKTPKLHVTHFAMIRVQFSLYGPILNKILFQL